MFPLSCSKGYPLSSVILDLSVVYAEIMQRINNDTFGTKTVWVSVPSGAIYPLEPNKVVPAKVKDELETVRKNIAAWKIEVVDIPAPADLDKYLDKAFPE